MSELAVKIGDILQIDYPIIEYELKANWVIDPSLDGIARVVENVSGSRPKISKYPLSLRKINKGVKLSNNLILGIDKDQVYLWYI